MSKEPAAQPQPRKATIRCTHPDDGTCSMCAPRGERSETREAELAIIYALRNFVDGIEGYRETGVWPDNGQLRQWADEGAKALESTSGTFENARKQTRNAQASGAASSEHPREDDPSQDRDIEIPQIPALSSDDYDNLVRDAMLWRKQQIAASSEPRKRHHYDAPDGFPCSCGKPIDDPIHIPRVEP